MFLPSLWPSYQTINHSLQLRIDHVLAHSRQKWIPSVLWSSNQQEYLLSWPSFLVVPLKMDTVRSLCIFRWCLCVLRQQSGLDFLFLCQRIVCINPWDHRNMLRARMYCCRNRNCEYLEVISPCNSLSLQSQCNPHRMYTTYIWYYWIHPALWLDGSTETQFMMGSSDWLVDMLVSHG